MTRATHVHEAMGGSWEDKFQDGWKKTRNRISTNESIFEACSLRIDHRKREKKRKKLGRCQDSVAMTTQPVWCVCYLFSCYGKHTSRIQFAHWSVSPGYRELADVKRPWCHRERVVSLFSVRSEIHTIDYPIKCPTQLYR